MHVWKINCYPCIILKETFQPFTAACRISTRSHPGTQQKCNSSATACMQAFCVIYVVRRRSPSSHSRPRASRVQGHGANLRGRRWTTGSRSSFRSRIGVGLSLVLFGVPALLLWLATTQLLPVLVARGWEPLLAWFASGALVLAPLLAAALLGAWMALPAPSLPAVLEHLRVRHLSGEEWRLAGFVLLFTFAAVAGLQLFNASVWPGLPPHPSFMAVRPLEIGQYYILALWLPFFVLNIVGEELLVARVHPAAPGAGVRSEHLGRPGPSSWPLSLQFRLWASCFVLLPVVFSHTVGRTAHAEYVGRHRHPCRGQRSRPSWLSRSASCQLDALGQHSVGTFATGTGVPASLDLTCGPNIAANRRPLTVKRQR